MDNVARNRPGRALFRSNDNPRRRLSRPDGRLHEDLGRADKISGPSDRRFGLSIAIICSVIAGADAVLGGARWPWWLAAALAFASFAIFWPSALRRLNRAWLLLGLSLHKIINPLAMALLFMSAIAPLGILMKLFGRDALRLKREPGAATYWVDREPPRPAVETMRDQF